jgi:Tol biopolymer transport system component/DNA-binding winged helix-turn-helix (wHTH) protein
MVNTEQQQPAHRFGVFELDIRRGELRKHGVRIRLQRQPLQILKLLLERPGEVVTREDIQKRLWPHDTYLAFDNAINSSVRKIREALGDTAENPRFIETLSRRGYRFIAPLSNGAPPALASGAGFGHVQAPADKQIDSISPLRGPSWRIALGIAGVCAISAVVLWFSRLKLNTNAPGELLTTVPFTSYPGYEVLPAFSPEGTRVAFSWQQPGSSYPEVYIKLIGAGQPVRLSSAGGLGPVWSPDGRFLAYVRPIDRWHAVVVITAAVAGHEREVTRIKYFGTNVDRCPWNIPAPLLAWSPDSKWLLTLDQETGGASQPHRIVRVSADGGEKRTLTSPPLYNLGNGGLALSPDGKRLAFTEDSGFWARDIYVAPVSDDFLFTAKPQRITFDHKAISGVGWTGDSKYLIFSSPRNGRSQLWKVAAKPGSEPVRLGLTDDEVTDVAISRDGKRLVYAHDLDDQNIWRASLHDRRVTTASNFIASTRRDVQAHYSPDEKRIAF